MSKLHRKKPDKGFKASTEMLHDCVVFKAHFWQCSKIVLGLYKTEKSCYGIFSNSVECGVSSD